MTQMDFEHTPIAEGIDLYSRPRKVVKSIVLRLTVEDAMVASRAGANTMVSALLRRGTNKHPSVAALAQFCDDLYGASMRIGVQKMGSRQLLALTLRLPSPAYIPQGMRTYRKAIGLLHDLFFDPRLEDGRFPETIFASEHAQLLRTIDQLQDNRGGYAMLRAREFALAGTHLGTPEFGSREAVAALTPARTTSAWKRLVTKAPIKIHLVGNFEHKHLAPIVKTFAGCAREGTIRLPGSRALKPADKARRKHERIEGEQTHSVLLFTSGISSASKGWPAVRLANAIFGRDASSRLFREVREKQGLAYSISSMLSPTSGMLTVYAGTDAEQAKAASDSSKRILKQLQRDGFTERELEVSRQVLLEETLAQADSLSGPILRHIAGEMRGVHRSLDQVEAALRAVTPRQVEAALGKLKLFFSYRLGP